MKRLSYAMACVFVVLLLSANANAVCGDVDNNGAINIADAVYLRNYIIGQGPAPDPYVNGDMDGYTGITGFDVSVLMDFLFSSGSQPVCEPSQQYQITQSDVKIAFSQLGGSWGVDEAEDTIRCIAYFPPSQDPFPIGAASIAVRMVRSDREPFEFTQLASAGFAQPRPNQLIPGADYDFVSKTNGAPGFSTGCVLVTVTPWCQAPCECEVSNSDCDYGGGGCKKYLFDLVVSGSPPQDEPAYMKITRFDIIDPEGFNENFLLDCSPKSGPGVMHLVSVQSDTEPAPMLSTPGLAILGIAILVPGAIILTRMRRTKMRC